MTAMIWGLGYILLLVYSNSVYVLDFYILCHFMSGQLTDIVKL